MKNLLLLAFSIFTINLIAQNAPIDFEENGNGANWTWTTFENDSNPPLDIVQNPDPSGLNPSDSVAVFKALATGAPFAGCESMHGADIGEFTLNSSNSTIRIMVWKSVISDVGIKLVEPGNGSLGELKVANTLINQWEELSFDFSDMEGILYDQIVIFPDFAARTEDNTVYFDNITFGETIPLATPMAAAPDPTIEEANVLSMFSNVYTDVAVDTWQTPWSEANLTDLQIQGNDTKRYNSLNFVGVETTGDNLIDATEMQFFHVDLWTPNMSTIRIKLVDFGADQAFDGGDDSEHEIIFDNLALNTWHSLMIPLSDFAGLNAQNNMAQLIFSGLPVGQGTIYVDNVYFSKDPVAVNEAALSDLNLYPNPAKEQVALKTDFAIEKVMIFDVFGKQVLTFQHQNTLAIESLPSGHYVILAIGKEKIAKGKLVKN